MARLVLDEIDDELHRKVKTYAASVRLTMKQVILNALERIVAESEETKKKGGAK